MNHLALKIRRTGPSARLALVTILASLAAGATLLAFADDSVQPRFIPKQGWTQGGYDASNNRHQPWQTRLGPKTAYRLQLKWSQTLHGDVSATPAVVGRHVYVPDWGGYLSKLDKYTGRVIWQKRLDSYAGEAAGAVSRTSPAYADGMLFIGDLSGGNVLAISAGTGELRWRVTISKGPAAQVTQSLLVQGGKVYAGVSSNEVMMASDPKYHCCVFQGSVSALDARSGRILWTTKMAPDNGGMPGGYSGVSVWGSTPVLDEETNTLYITTGNNYALPFTVKECELKGGKDCQDRRNLVDAIVALDSRSGALKWATGTREFDDWNGGCFTGPPGVGNCPLQPGPDHDFGSGVNLFSIKDARGRFRRVVGAGQKSGIYWLIDAVNGKILWARRVVPGSSLGGLMWGTAAAGCLARAALIPCELLNT